MKGAMFVAAGLAATLAGVRGVNPAAPQQAADPEVPEFVELVNAARAEAGCKALVWYEPAAVVARGHSADMKSRDYFSHTNPDGADPFDRLAAAGIGYRSAAENILSGEGGAKRVLDLWLNSPGHRANLLKCSFTHHGVGRVDTYWTHVFLQDPRATAGGTSPVERFGVVGGDPAPSVEIGRKIR